MLLIFAVMILVLRAFYITVVQGDTYRLLSDSNRVRTTIIHAPRGIIFDRSGNPLVYNTPGFRKVSKNTITMLDSQTALQMLAKGDKSVEIDSLRTYPYKDVFAHVVGYLGGSDFLGKEGIEQFYEGSLRGIDGKQLSEVDALGKSVRKLGVTDAIPGKDITSTLDVDLQKAVFDAMKNVSKGSVVVTTPQGQILALVSKPSFDPNLFTMGKRYKTATTSGYQNVSQVLLDDSSQPLLNRAISGTYPPGSTFKLITAVAGLETKRIDQNFSMQDTGILKIGEFSFGNWYYLQYGKTDGTVDVVKAIKRSNDIFFYTVAQKVGVNALSQVAKQFGVGSMLGIDLLGEVPGTLPTSEWKEKVLKEQWYLGDTYHYGIGQGYLLTTPLQVNAWTQVIANGGTLYRPRLVEKNEDPVIGKVPIAHESLELIRKGMIESCSTGGVAWPLFNFTITNEKLRIDGKNILEAPRATGSANIKGRRMITVACKTGTAQHGGESDLPHAWITLFAPAYNPQIVVTVLSESSGEGSNEAAPIAKKILESWFGKRLDK